MAKALIDDGVIEPTVQMQADSVIAAARQFPARTAWGPDGLHARQIALISPPLAEALATSLHILSVSGLAPVQAMLMTAPLIPKPQVGHRPIGVFSSWVIVWSK